MPGFADAHPTPPKHGVPEREAPEREAPKHEVPEREDPHYTGHRDRLRQRFLSSGGGGLQDYELLELLLFPLIPRRDVKPLAKDLIREFGSLWGTLNAAPERLRRAFNFSDTVIAALTAVGAAGLRASRQQVLMRPVLAGWDAIVDYCQSAMAHETTEQVRLLFLDRNNRLIAEEVQQRGTIDHTAVYPREIVRRALELGAHAIILVHNHPTGDSTPSRDDITMTKEIARAVQALGMVLHDHLIIGRGQVASFKALGLL